MILHTTDGLDVKPTNPLPVLLYDAAGNPLLGGPAAPLADNTPNPTTGKVASFTHLWNENAWDRARGNTNLTLLASAARTVQTATADQSNYNARGLMLFLNVTAASGLGGLSLYLQAKDPLTGNYVSMVLLAGPITTIGQRAYLVYPGAATTGALPTPTQQALPRSWRALVDVADATSYTYSLAAALIL